MVIEKQKSCPVCKLEGNDIFIKDRGELILVECQRCGNFIITRTAATTIKRHHVNYKLSSWLRNYHQNDDPIFEIDSKNIKEIISTLPNYNFLEKQHLLLSNFARLAESAGYRISVIPLLDYPVAWARDEQEFKYILGLLIDNDFIRIIDAPPDVDDFVITIEITANGWNKIREEIPSPKKIDNENNKYDVFISHASEDKDTIARPLYNALIQKDISVWFDEAVLTLGDSLRRKIDEGLRVCRFGVVILSHNFFSKKWPENELNALVARETTSGEKAILPVWHNVGKSEVLQYSPVLADRVAAKTSEGIPILADKICNVLNK